MSLLQPRIIALATTNRASNYLIRNYMKGPGSRAEQNRRPMGLTTASVKAHYSLIPLYGAFGFAMSCVALYIYKLLVNNEVVSWAKHQRFDDQPWNHWSNKEFKIINITPSPDCQAPDYKN